MVNHQWWTELEPCRCDTNDGGNNKRVSEYFFYNIAQHSGKRLRLIIAKRHQGRGQGKKQGVVQAKHQSYGYTGFRTKCCQRQRRSHIADVAIGTGESLHGGSSGITLPYQTGDAKAQCKNSDSCCRCADQKTGVYEFVNRCLRQYLEK